LQGRVYDCFRGKRDQMLDKESGRRMYRGGTETVAKIFDPELERRRQLAEVEILEAEARIRKALADTREFYAQRRKPAVVP
jgi:hypothetical protein